VSTEGAFRRSIREARETSAPDTSDIVVDFTAVSFCDSTALRVLADAAAALKADGRDLTIVNPSRQLMRMARILGMEDVLA
jgi:anti-anti-sigma factor